MDEAKRRGERCLVSTYSDPSKKIAKQILEEIELAERKAKEKARLAAEAEEKRKAETSVGIVGLPENCNNVHVELTREVWEKIHRPNSDLSLNKMIEAMAWCTTESGFYVVKLGGTGGDSPTISSFGRYIQWATYGPFSKSVDCIDRAMPDRPAYYRLNTGSDINKTCG